MTDLGTLGGSYSQAFGINNSGQVVGFAATPDFYHAFRTAPNQPINPPTDDLGTLGGAFSQALGINDSGQVVGSAYISGQTAVHAFCTSANQPITSSDDLGTFGGLCSYAVAINLSGQVVGYAQLDRYDRFGNQIFHAFRTAYNQPISPNTNDLGTLPGWLNSIAVDINDIGQVVGAAYNNGEVESMHGFRTTANQSINPSDDLGALGGIGCNPSAINNSGQVVGGSITNGSDRTSEHAFRTAANQPINPATDDLGTLGGTNSYAHDINNSGEVVGTAYVEGDCLAGGIRHAFLYGGNGPMQDLNNLIDSASGWTLEDAYSINDLGQIVGCGTYGGYTHAFLLTPIPEPSTLALLSMGGVGLVACGSRRRKAHRIVVCFIALLASTAWMAKADVYNMGGTRNADGTWTGLASLETVLVGNVNNSPDAYTGNLYGSVDHTYAIGKYEVTAGQYCEFLNAKAKTDSYGLYNFGMWSSSFGCKIQRTGNSGSYAYSVSADYANRPVNYVSFWGAARFTNWLCNGQGSGDTETGAYTLGGYNGNDGHLIVKNAGAQWWIPSENEWYKAAYNNGGSASANYYRYPTSSNVIPSNVLDTPVDLGNNATFYNNGYTIDSPYYRTEVGAHENSDSPYGTFDQGGNVWEWFDMVNNNSLRGVRGGAFKNNSNGLGSSNRDSPYPTGVSDVLGFRVACVPEPGSLAMLLSIAVGGFIYLRRRKA